MAAAHHIRQSIKGVVAIVTEYEDSSLPSTMQQLAKKLGLESKADTPALMMVHGNESKAVMYPYDLSTMELSPEMLLLWTRRTILEIEQPILQKYVKELEANETVELDLLELYVKRLEQLEEELAIVEKTFDKAQAEVKEARKAWKSE